VLGEPGAGDVGSGDVGRGAGGGQAFLDLGEGGSGAGGEARAGQLGTVDDIDVEVEVDGGGAELAEGGGDRGGVGGHAADATGGEGVALGGVEIAGVSEHDPVSGTGRRPSVSSNRPGVRPVSMASAMPPR
jgi:hypothetical protein